MGEIAQSSAKSKIPLGILFSLWSVTAAMSAVMDTSTSSSKCRKLFAPDVKDQKWIALKIYVHFFNTYSATYGSLGAVIILLLWFYLTGAAVLLGAEINSIMEDDAAQEGDPEAKMKGEKAPQQPAQPISTTKARVKSA